MKLLQRIVFFIGCSLVLTLPTAAQNPVVISVLLPEPIVQFRPVRQILDEFETQNPGIHVEIIAGNPIISPPTSPEAIDQYINSVEAVVRRADVIPVDSSWLLPEATQAGLILDLSPLTDQDLLLADSFRTNALESFQWDDGVWAVPDTLDLITLLYDPAAFDSIGLAYPDPNWQIEDYAQAARLLTAEKPGIAFEDVEAFRAFARSMVTDGFYTPNEIPVSVIFTDSNTTTLVDNLMQLSGERALQLPELFVDNENVPMIVARSSQILTHDGYQLSTLGNQRSGFFASGFAASRGTAYPEEAYALIKFLSDHPGFSSVTAHLPAQPDKVNTNTAVSYPDDVAMQVEAMQEHTMPSAEYRFANYLISATSMVDSGSSDAATLLTVLQSDLNDELVNLRASRDERQITVDAPPQRPDVNSSEVTINFGVLSRISPLPTRTAWEQAASDFAAEDNMIDLVTIESMTVSGVLDREPMLDCFYSPTNLLSEIDISRLLSIGPLIQSDPSFASDDLIGDVLQQVTLSDQILAVPVSIQPEVMWLNTALFDEGGAAMPAIDSWNSAGFIQAVNDLSFSSEVEPIVSVYNYGGTHLLLLVAAFGGTPIDYRTDPPTIDFTSSRSIDAIRQVLDLARNDLMGYQRLYPSGAESGSGVTPIVIASMDDSSSRSGQLVVVAAERPRFDVVAAYRPYPYPVGLDVTPIAYDVGGGYIFANTQYPEACYRFIRYAAQQPETFNGIPVRRSLANSPTYASSRTPEQIEFYNVIAQLLESPNTMEISTRSTGVERWLFRAFDNYVFRGENLETELEQAQLDTLTYLQCVEELPAFDPGSQTRREYFDMLHECEIQVESSG